ncbi:MAG: glycerol-3-phosphate 1-O-acyltransferase PlsY [Bacilli bacterium]|nr:glycerol-3-phosphate 1-O-acyltransferase PlsY [Bacilli bacterium]
MNIFYIVLITLGIAISGYLIGSISWAVIITKFVFHIDIYKVGSGNAGGTNVGRAIGKKWAIITIVLDVIKCLVPLWSWFFILTLSPLNGFMSENIGSFPLSFFYYLAGFTASIGHIYPLYFHFKGGKAVSCFGGFILGTNWMLMVLGFGTFLLTLKWKKRVSLSSISGTVVCMVLAIVTAIVNQFCSNVLGISFWFFPGPKFDSYYMYSIFVIIYGLLVIFLHKRNINRLVNHTEPETHFYKEGEVRQSNYDQDK